MGTNNYATCQHTDNGGKTICGAFAAHEIEIAEGAIPPMPVCRIHAPIYTKEMVEIITQMAVVEFFLENPDAFSE